MVPIDCSSLGTHMMLLWIKMVVLFLLLSWLVSLFQNGNGEGLLSKTGFDPLSLVPSRDSVFCCITALTMQISTALYLTWLFLGLPPILDCHLFGAQPEIWSESLSPRACKKTGQKWTFNKYLTTPVSKCFHPKWSKLKKKNVCLTI